jgi:23S rRNA (uracil1939-C5)-methyltransferase
MRRRQRQRGELEQPRQLEVTLSDMAYEGNAFARYDDGVIFAEYGIPGERVTVELYREHSGVAHGRVIEVHDASPDRIEPPCPYFGICGGCQWQHISYERQLALKQHVVSEQLRRIGKFSVQPVSEIVGAEEPLGYRNHVRFSAGKDGALGFVRRSSHSFLSVERCLIAQPAINETLARCQGNAAFVHQLEVRVGVNTGDILIQPPESGEKRKGGSYREALLGRVFEVSSASFFQSNTRQAERLIQLVIEKLAPRKEDLLVDAYAGVGIFAALLAPLVERVIAIEEAPNAVADAIVNMADLNNVECIEGKVEDVLPEFDARPDAVILDPPRQGCHPGVLDAILSLGPPRLVYVSCDPATLARDLRILVDGGYELLDVTPLDMFPQTFHVECVATLRRAGASATGTQDDS